MSQDTAAQQPQFGKLRQFFWPIYNFELKKIIPMLFMFLFISFNYSILRGLKDGLVIPAAKDLAATAGNLPPYGAEVLAFLKTGFVVPIAILFMLFFSKLNNVLSKQNVFYVTILPFIIFYAFFAFVLYPYHEYLHPTEYAAKFLADSQNNAFLFAMVASFTNWTFSLFYVFAELWGSVVLSLLFWSFANDITKVSEAKRFYALFGIGANVGLLTAGPMLTYFSNLGLTLPEGVDPFQHTLNILIPAVISFAFVIMMIYRWINKNVLTDPRFYNPDEAKGGKKKPKLGLMDSIKFIGSSKYLGLITILVISYGISIILIEMTWKSKIVELYPSKNELAAFMGNYFVAIALSTIFLMVFVSSQVTRILGWRIAALLTPVVLFITGAGFFSFILFGDSIIGFFEMTATPLVIAVAFGTIQNVMSKSTKYSLFDPTKEMTYIPLDPESKTKGKAAVDVVGARVGKAGGAMLQLALFAFVGGIVAITPHIAVMLLVIVSLWIYAVFALSKEFKKREVTSDMA